MKRRTAIAATASLVGVTGGVYGLQSLGNQRPNLESQPETTPPTDTHESAKTATASPTEEPTATPVPVGETRTGSTLSGISPRSFSGEYFDAIEQWLDKRQAVCVFFSNMDRSAEDIERVVGLLEEIWQRGYVPQMFWQPNYGSRDNQDGTFTRQVAEGQYDDSIERWAKALAEWALRPDDQPDRRLFINLAPEFNGAWAPWGVPRERVTPETYVGMWRRIRELVMATDLQSDHLQWIWTVNNYSSVPIDLSTCYPGDTYVDWVGITGYNWVEWGGWKTPAETYSTFLNHVRDIAEKPVSISEFGASADCSSGHCPNRKNEWISEVYQYFIDQRVRMACWFDHFIEKDQTDWGVFDAKFGPNRFEFEGTKYRVYDNYRAAIQRPELLGAHPVDARRLTDKEFLGEFPSETG